MKKNFLNAFVGFLFLATAFYALGCGQQQGGESAYGSISGKVTKMGGALFSGATVTAIKDGYSGSTTSSSSGTYVFSGLSAGVYLVTASATGYCSSSESVTVTGSQESVKNFTLITPSIYFSGIDTVEAVSADIIRLWWVPATSESSSSFYYYVFITKEAGKYDMENPSYIYGGLQNYYTIPTLEANTSYYAIIRAQDSDLNQDPNLVEKVCTTEASSSWEMFIVEMTSEAYGKHSSLVINSSDNWGAICTKDNYQGFILAEIEQEDPFHGILHLEKPAQLPTFNSVAVRSDVLKYVFYDATNKELNLGLKETSIGASTRYMAGSYCNEVADSNGDVGQYCSLALNATGNYAVSYYDATNGDLKYITSTAYATHDAATIVDSNGDVGQHTSIAFLGIEPIIAYYDVSNGNLKFGRLSNSVWSIQALDSSGDVGQYTSMAVDGNNIHLCYYDATNGDLKYIKYSNSSWGDPEIVDSSGDVGLYASLALDASGQPHISYYDATNGNLNYASYQNGSWSTQIIARDHDQGQYSSLKFTSTGKARISFYDVTFQKLKLAIEK